MKDLSQNALDDADALLNLPHRELLAHSLQEEKEWVGNCQMAMVIKNQKTNESLVRVTWFLAIGTLLLSGLTICVQLGWLG